MQDKRDLTIKELAKDCRTIEDVHIMLKDLFCDTILGFVEVDYARQELERMYIAACHPFWRAVASGTVRLIQLLSRLDMEPLRA